MSGPARSAHGSTEAASFDASALARLTGVGVSDAALAAIFAGLPVLRSAPVTAARRQEILHEVDATIAAARFRVVAGGDAQAVWTKGWAEVAEAVRRADRVTLETLKPQYFHPGVPFRYTGEYAVPLTDYFEYYAGIAVRRQLMLAAFPGTTRLVELGCGTGLNLILAAELFPQAALIGTDWVQPTLDILAIAGKTVGREIQGVLYDMLTGAGRDGVPIDEGTDVLTVHALEQLGSRGAAVADELLARRPRRVLHIEPILDFYDRADQFDDIAARYHLARGYLTGLLPALRAHAEAGRVEITAEGRVRLGNLYHEAYSYIAWQPV